MQEMQLTFRPGVATAGQSTGGCGCEQLKLLLTYVHRQKRAHMADTGCAKHVHPSAT